MGWLLNPEIWIALVTLTILEIVLGVDNVIFISILSAKLPARRQRPARRLGLALAMVTRIALLLSISWIIRLTEPLFAVAGHDFSGRALTLLLGGLFLLGKSTYEIHESLEGDEGRTSAKVAASFASVYELGLRAQGLLPTPPCRRSGFLGCKLKPRAGCGGTARAERLLT